MDDERYESEEPFREFCVYPDFEDGRFAVAIERCPLCLRTRRPFYCKQCISTGRFTRHSDESERYCDLQQKLELVTKERRKLVERIEQRVAAREARAFKRDEIAELKHRNHYLKLAIKEANIKKKELDRIHQKRSRACRKDGEKIRKSHASVPKMQATYSESKHKLSQRREELKSRNGLLMEQRRSVMNELVHYIFPLVELTAEGANSLGLEESCLAMSTAQKLSEACRLNYMSGQWVHTDRYGNTLVKIVESTLPGNGDYSAAVTRKVHELASLSQDSVRFTGNNSTYAVVSGLCFTTQLVNGLASILNITLPRKLNYSTFGCDDFDERKLVQAVGQLNHNMLHLCFSQGVDPGGLIARHTMLNLLLLLRSEHLGRELAFRDNQNLITAVNDGCVSEDESEKDEGEGSNDWDFVNRGDLPEVSLPGQVSESWPFSTQSTASDLVTSAAASVASLWRTATGRHSSDS